MTNKNVQLDWLSLGTWNFVAYTQAAAIIHQVTEDWTPRNWLQYSGKGTAGCFHGRGEQKGRPHYMIRLSGRTASDIWDTLLGVRHLYCTRMDVQVTVKRPDGWTLTDIHSRTEYATKSLIIGDKNDTLYIGNRSSPLFTRLYEKIYESVYLRLEFELKGGRARAAWGNMTLGRLTPTEIFAYFLDKSHLPNDVKDLYTVGQAVPNDELLKMEQQKTAQQKLDWLYSISNAIYEAMNDHDIGQEVQSLVQHWYNAIQNIDN